MKRMLAALVLGAVLAGTAPAGAWESPQIRAKVTQWKTWWVPDAEYWRVNGWVRIRNKTDIAQAISCRVDAFASSGRRVGTVQVSKALKAHQAKGSKFDIFGPYGGSKDKKKPTRVKIRRCWIL